MAMSRLAYQVVEQSGGNRPPDLVVVPGLVLHLGLVWEEPAQTRFDLLARSWGSCVLPPRVAPSLAGDQGFRRSWARFERTSASLDAAVAPLRIDRDGDRVIAEIGNFLSGAGRKAA